MTLLDWMQLAIFILLLTLIVKPLGLYLHYVLDPEGRTWLDPVFKPLEKITYRLCGIDPKNGQTWKGYLGSILIFSSVSLVITFFLLRYQNLFPLNPQERGELSFDLSFNTAMSFMTNTNWQSYSGESTISYFSQMVALTLQNFVSPAVGLTVAAALARGLRRRAEKTLGNFWVDLIRICYYFLLPLSFFLAIFFVCQGVPQNFDAYAMGNIVEGPIASQEAIKLLGTNGGGFTNVNSAHPYENPTPLCNFLQILALLSIPAGQTYYFGREVKNQKHGWALYAVMILFFTVAVIFCSYSEREITPHLEGISGGNMEGKEVRFGTFGSALFATGTTMTSCGAVNSMHDSYMPLGGIVPLIGMELGEVIFGGAGAGLYSIVIFVILTFFIAGLIIGRMPEYLGQRIEAFEVKCALFATMAFFVVILGFTAAASSSSWGLKGLGNSGPHGFSEILYAYSSSAANNGSSFAGLSSNTPWYNYTTAFVMLAGRFFVIIPVMAIAGAFLSKKAIPMGLASFPITGVTFVFLLLGVILVISFLAFLPALCFGPILESIFMDGGQLF